MNPIKIDPEIMSGTPCFEGTPGSRAHTLRRVYRRENARGLPARISERHAGAVIAVLELAADRVVTASKQQSS
jgi:hypothetical protein